MEYKGFYEVTGIPVAELLLDTDNPRIRKGWDQRNCIEKLLRRQESFMNLVRDIAENGLSIERIVISKNEDGKWVVRDGNRRIAALKLLNEPELCPDPELRPKIKQLAEKYRENIPSQVDCMASDDEDAIVRYLELKHTGANEGIGQESWSAFMKAVFNVSRGAPDQNKRAVQLLLWAEQQGIVVEDDFPLTTLTRLLNQKTLKLMGFEVKDDDLHLILPIDIAKRIVHRVISDLATKRIQVEDVFTPRQQLEYVRGIRNEIIPEPVNTETALEATGDKTDSTVRERGHDRGQTVDTVLPQQEIPSQDVPAQRQTTGRQRGSTAKPSWERKCIFPNKSPGFQIPSEFTKANNILVELRKLNVQETPIAVALLLRTLVELSEQHYRIVNGIPKKDKLNQRVAAAAEHMASKGRITADQKEVILRRTRDEHDMLHVTTLHKYVHSPDFHPTYAVLNSLWDEIGFFVAECWRS